MGCSAVSDDDDDDDDNNNNNKLIERFWQTGLT
jgi:hypothetical protein